MLTEIKNEWRYTSTPPTCRHGVHRHSCAFTSVSAGTVANSDSSLADGTTLLDCRLAPRSSAELRSSGLFRTEWWRRGGSLKSGCAETLVRDYHYRYVRARKSAVVKHTAPDSSRGVWVALRGRSQRGTGPAGYKHSGFPTCSQQTHSSSQHRPIRQYYRAATDSTAEGIISRVAGTPSRHCTVTADKQTVQNHGRPEKRELPGQADNITPFQMNYI